MVGVRFASVVLSSAAFALAAGAVYAKRQPPRPQPASPTCQEPRRHPVTMRDTADGPSAETRRRLVRCETRLRN